MSDIRSILNWEVLQDFHIPNGLVTERKHPDYPLWILNYTAKCQYEGPWDDVTTQCRGLIYNSETGQVVARPFRKFFNFGDPNCGDIDPTEPVNVTDKMDGSLGILYYTPDGTAIATRGSFDSDQAKHATQIFRQKYAANDVCVGFTFLFEIVYPNNRIVLDYGDMDDLVFLGAVQTATGESLPPHHFGWHGPVVDRFHYASLQETLEAAPRSNAEGLVVHFLRSDNRVKIKQEDYKRLHKILSGLNDRMIWEHLSLGNPVNSLLDNLPDEFHHWTCAVADEMVNRATQMHKQLKLEFDALIHWMPEGYTRKDFALRIADNRNRNYLFSLMDNRDIMPAIWKELRPLEISRPSGLGVDPDA